MPFYRDGNYYGSDNFYGVNSTAPINLSYYFTDIDNVLVFSWTLQEPLFTPTISTFDYELQIDVDPTFSSPSFLSFTSTSGIINAPALSFQNGNVYKGFAVPMYTRRASPITFYARVSIKGGGAWSDVLIGQTLIDSTQTEVHNLINNLPDMHVYPYDEAYKTVTRTSSQLTTNIGKTYWAYAREFDNANLEAQLADNDSSVYRARDSKFFAVFGYPTGFQKPSTMQNVDYRNIVNRFRLACFEGSTTGAVNEVIKAFTGVSPTIIPFSQFLSFITANKTVETHAVPGSGPYTITLANLPRNCPSIPGFTFTDGTVGADQFSVNFSTGVLTFHSSDAGVVVTITYVDAADIYSVLGSQTTESHTVPNSGPYTITLANLPRNCPTIPGFTFTNGVVGADQFSVNFSTGVLTFHSSDASAIISVTYLSATLSPAPPVIYNRREAGSGVEILINNPAAFALDLAAIDFLIRQIVPASVRYILVPN